MDRDRTAADGSGEPRTPKTSGHKDNRTISMSQTAPKQFLTDVARDISKPTKEDAEREIARMVSEDQCIGDLITLDYGHADILVHDTHRNPGEWNPTRMPPAGHANHASRSIGDDTPQRPNAAPDQGVGEHTAAK